MPEQTVSAKAEIKRVGKFGLVGALNTLIDFTLFNLLSSHAGLTLIEANLISTTVAMIISFFANRRLVFGHHTGSFVRQVVTFYVVTAFGLYVLQTGAIRVLTTDWTGPVNLAVSAFAAIGITGHNQFIIKNTAKLVGTIISLAWNYFTYKTWVFI